MKRIYIAVGSEALKGVANLVKRLCEENLFKRFDDRYIAIDSDGGKIDAFNAIGSRLHTPRIKGFVLQIDPVADGTVEKTFSKSWVARQVPAGGVGGDRTISGKALSIVRKIWNDTDLALGEGLEPEDEIFVVGSAFGGTSGGLFLNVCEYLDLQIRMKRNGNPEFKNVKVNGVLMLPEATVKTGTYPIATNMIDMFRDLQTSSWRRRLESRRPSFKVPVWPHYNGRVFELYNGTDLLDYGIQGSSLPMSNLYVVPTPRGKISYHSTMLTEVLFVAGYLQIDYGHANTVNRLIAGNLGPLNNLSVEDACVCGFNMFAMKSGRLITLKNWFWTQLIEAVVGQNGRGGLMGSADTHPVVPANVKAVFQQVQTPDRDQPNVGIDLDECGPLETLLEKTRDALISQKALTEYASQLNGYLDAVRAAVPSYQAIPAKELIVLLSASCYSGWNREMNFNLIKSGYRAFYAEIKQQSKNREVLKNEILKTLQNALKLIDVRKKHRVVRNWAWGLAKESAVFQEIADAFQSKFSSLLRAYLFACRCAKTDLLDENAFTVELLQFADACNALKMRLREKCDSLRGAENPYIADGLLIQPLKSLPPEKEKELGFDPLQTLMAVVYRSFVSSQQDNKKTLEAFAALGSPSLLLADGLSDANTILDVAEEATINRYIEISEELLPGVNPLTDATIADFADVKARSCGCSTYASELKVPDSKANHYHFVVQEGKLPRDFKMTNEDVSGAPLRLDTMAGTQNSAASFMDTLSSHGRMDDPVFWKTANMPESPVFSGLLNPEKSRQAQGLWIGTLGIDFGMREILDKVYAASETVKLDFIRAGLASDRQRRTMTLVEMVKFGVVVEALEEKMKEVWRQHRMQPGSEQDSVLSNKSVVSISFEKHGRQFVLDAAQLVNMGFVDREDSCSLASMTPEWVGKILSWIRATDATCFRTFYPTANFQSMENAETNIFSSLRLSITDAEIQAIDAAKAVIKGTVTIKGL